MAKKSYKQHCGLARALDIVGERWTLLIVRELLLGPRRYTQLMASLTGITTNLLASRLQAMQEHGLLEKNDQGYALSERGKALETPLLALGAWGQTLLAEPVAGHRRNVGWALISLKRRYRKTLDCTLELRVGQRCFELICSAEGLEVREAAGRRPNLVLSLSEEEFFCYFMARQAVAELSVAGDPELWNQVRAAFELP